MKSTQMRPRIRSRATPFPSSAGYPIWSAMQKRANLISLTFVAASLLLLGCSAHIDGYRGQTLARTEVADVRVIAVGDESTGVDLVNPATNTPIGNGMIVNHYGRTPWLRLPEARHCLLVQSWSVKCASLIEALNPHNPGCRRIGLITAREICIDAKGGKTYEIQVSPGIGTQLCDGNVFYRVVDVVAGTTIEEYGAAEKCHPSGEP